jgi:hypothetical protein
MYPIYKKLIDDTKAEINELRNHLALCCKTSNSGGGGHGGTTTDSVQEYAVRIATLEADLEHYRWRVKKTEKGLKYFESNKELMELITQKYFVCNDWDNTMIMAKLGYSTRPGRYYGLLKQIIEVFGKFYKVMP